MFSNETKNIDDYKVELTSGNSNIINNTLKYYVSCALFYKNALTVLSIILLAINCIIPLINQLAFKNYSIWITTLSAIAAFITGIISFIDFRNKWYRYRSDAENLKTECNLYNASYGRYANLEKSEKDRILVERFEEINGKDLSMWKKEMNKKFKESDDEEEASKNENKNHDIKSGTSINV